MPTEGEVWWVCSEGRVEDVCVQRDRAFTPLMGLYDVPFEHRVEKKERARLKTVKFHARTGMIESNRVSVAW